MLQTRGLTCSMALLQVQTVVRAPSEGRQRVLRKKNPLTNLQAMLRLNPYAQTLRRMEHSAQVRLPLSAGHTNSRAELLTGRSAARPLIVHQCRAIFSTARLAG